MTKSKEILDKHLLKNGWAKQIKKESNLYNTLVDAMEEAVNYSHCCTQLKAFKNDEIVALDGTLEVKIINIESKILVKVIEDDTLMWVNKHRLKKEYSF